MDYATLYELLFALSTLLSFPVMFGCFLGCLVEGFFGYKLYKTFLRLTYAIGAGTLAYYIIIYFLPVDTWLPDVFGLSWIAIIVLVVAVLGAILAPFIYKFVGGAAVGASIGVELMVVFGVENAIAVGIVAGILAILVGLLFIKIFKAVYILSSSFGGMIGASAALGVLLFPNTILYSLKTVLTEAFLQAGATAADIETAMEETGLNLVTQPTSNIGGYIVVGLLALGVIMGIVATIVQFKKNEDN